jgi:hypothetical protein
MENLFNKNETSSFNKNPFIKEVSLDEDISLVEEDYATADESEVDWAAL